MQDIETLINHFLSVSWGPVIPPDEATVESEATKGINSYYLVTTAAQRHIGRGSERRRLPICR